MRNAHSVIVAILALGAAATSLRAQTSYPMITHVMPIAVQRGQTAEVTVEGQMNFFGVYKALFDGPGFSAEVLPDAKPAKTNDKSSIRSVKLKLTVSKEAALGIHDFRLASSLGVSSIGQLVVVDEPIIMESGDNNTPAKANAIAPPCVVSGRIEAVEDVDYFKFHADAGKTFTFEVVCARIQDKIHDLQKHADPILTLYDAEGRELAANDDFFFADPLLTYTVPKAGDYFIQVRDSKYDGDPRWAYALRVTDQPSVSHIFPMAGNPGQKIDVEPIGSAKMAKQKVQLTAPADVGIHAVQLDLGGVRTNPVAFIVSPLPQVTEKEPNDTVEQAMRITLPCGVNGRIGKRHDLDHFLFAAKKGKPVRFEVKARRFGTILQSSLDSVLDVLSPQGQILATNDDTFGKDAALVFAPPADGDYIVRLRDLNSKGGDTAVYYLECDWAKPDFTLRCDPDKAMIGPGSSTAWFAQVTRSNGFEGPVQIEVGGLPKGVTVNTLTIPPSMTQGLLVVTAAADAPRDAVNVQILGKAKIKDGDGKEETIVRPATPNEEIYLPGGGRGRFEVRMQTVAVTESSDILKVEVTPKTVSLKPGEEVRLDVTVLRRADYDKSISMDILLRHLGQVFGNPLPTDVTIVEAKSKTLLGTGSKGHIVLRAGPNATPIENVPISVLVHVSINFVVKVSYSSPPILLTIKK
jgi:hypothetical protein